MFRSIDRQVRRFLLATALVVAPLPLMAQTAAPAAPVTAAAPSAATPAPAKTATVKKSKKTKAAAADAAAPAPAASPSTSSAAAAPAGAGSAVFPDKVDAKYASQKPGDARMHTCLDQYHANKASNGNGGMKWIQKGGGYYSECSKKLKG